MNIEYIIETIRCTRQNFMKLVDGCSLEKLNHIPEGFSNNIVWNLAHVISSQQVLCYELSGLSLRVDESFADAYRPGTFPEKFVSESRLGMITEELFKTIDWLSDDYGSGVFKNYKERQTKFGVLITNIDEAISYVSTHETLHFGYAKALSRLIG